MITEKQINETKTSLAVIEAALAAINEYWKTDAAAPSIVLLEVSAARKALEQAKHYANLVIGGDSPTPHRVVRGIPPGTPADPIEECQKMAAKLESARQALKAIVDNADCPRAVEIASDELRLG